MRRAPRRSVTVVTAVTVVACAAAIVTGAWAFTRSPAKSVGRGLSDADLGSIYTHWLASPYEYMFDRGGQPLLTINGRPYGTFLAGIDGIMRYGGMAEAAAKHLQIRQRGFYDLTPMEQLSKLKIFSRKATGTKRFSRYNPKLIRWGHENLIPAPGLKVSGHSCQELYDKLFARFFRLMAESYLLLHDGGQARVKREARAYLRAMKRRRFDGIDYLQDRYATALTGYQVPQNGTNFTPQMAIGFWVRRSVDRTDGELWTGLQKVLRQYDLKWWTALQQQRRPAARPRPRPKPKSKSKSKGSRSRGGGSRPQR